MAKINEKTKVRLWIVAILIIAVVLGALDYPKYIDQGINKVNEKWGTQFSQVYDLPFHLGLDLQGGTHLVYEANVSEIPTAEQGDSMEGVRDVIERRVNTLGVAEPIVQVNQSRDKWRVIVELAGVQDVNEAIKMIGETPLLEFKEENNEPARALTAEEKQQMQAYNEQAQINANEAFKKALAGDDFGALVTQYSQDEYSKSLDGNLGFIGSADTEYLQLYNAIQENNPQIGSVMDKLLETDDGYFIIKVEDAQSGVDQVKASHLLICFEGKDYCENPISQQEAQDKINDLKNQATAENFAQLVKENSTEPGAFDTAGDLGWFSKGQMVPVFENAVFNMETNTISEVIETDFGYHLIYKQDVRQDQEYKIAMIFVDTQTEADILPPQEQWKNTDLSGKNLKRALVEFDPNTNAPQVSLEFNDEGKDLFAEITGRNIGKPVAIFLDNQAISVPVVQSAIKEGRAVITGNFDLAEAKDLVRKLNAGALPVPINLVSQQTVGASLGAESLQKSLFAGLMGLLLVALFMIVYYRLPGLTAVLALVVYTAVIIFIFKIIPVTLTLSGIAGVILSLGMAVDANVLIFERLKEELKIGKPLGSAIDEGFKRAWPSIRDGNVSTLITCFVLAFFGTSMIQGFAITLGIGVVFSMLSAILITRIFIKLFMNMKSSKQNFYFGVKKEKQD